MERIFIVGLFCLMQLAASAQVVAGASKIEGTWSGTLDLGVQKLALVFNFECAGDDVACTMDSPDQGAKGIRMTTDFLSDDSVAVSVNALNMTYCARIGDGVLDGTFVQNGMALPLVMKKGEAKRLRPQMPTEPYPYMTEEVRFTNEADGVTLAGTLTYPVGYEAQKRGRVPVVLMVTGSGLQNRDEEIYGHKPFLVIADYLARHGIASLRYDDRGFGESGGKEKVKDATTLDFMRDAEAGIAYLRGVKKFGAVGVIGHSEGGNIAFMLGRDKAVDFVVSMAGVGAKVDTALTAQVNRIMELQGQAVRISTEQYRQNVRASQSGAWMDWFVDYDPTADIAAVKCPVMAINGDKDCQVISTLNLPSIRLLLQKNKHVLVKEYPSLNHLFQHCQTGLPAEYGNIEETISPEVLTDITKWINGVK